MKYLDLSLALPEENLALDEALVDQCDEEGGGGVLRFWESKQHFVVVGYSNQIDEEVRVEDCREKTIPILRRCSGGGTVLQGPGCLNYTLAFPIGDSSELQTVTGTNRFVMNKHRDILTILLGTSVEVLGHTDLALNHLKFSGNAQRRKRRTLLFHGTFLLHFELRLVGELLRLPSKQPAYRESRSHEKFLVNLGIPAPTVKSALKKGWNVSEQLQLAPLERMKQLVTDKYANAAWTACR